MGEIKKLVALMSPKGGIGKSVITSILAVTLQRRGLRIGILDGDLMGPSILMNFGIDSTFIQHASGKTQPLESKSGIKIMSMNVFLEDSNMPLTWQGPLLSSAFTELYRETAWGSLDYLLIDVSCDTSDVPMTILHELSIDGVLVVTSPQKIGLSVTKRCINFVRHFHRPILGIVENTTYLHLANGEHYELYESGYSEQLTIFAKAPLVAQIPLDPALTALCDLGQVEEYVSPQCEVFATNFMKECNISI